MIKFLTIENSNEKQKLLANLNPDSQTWIVADLNTKNAIQEELLKRTNCLPEDAVLRASELWRKILQQNHPDFELASTQLISTLLSEWLRARDLKWARHPGTPQTLVQYMGALLPILPHEDLTERVREWLRENPEALMRWGHWFELSVEAWGYFYKEKILASTWVSAFLSSHSNSVWPRDIFVDVGPDLVGTEIDLLKNLARKCDLTLLAPNEKWVARYRATLWPYEILSEQNIKSEPQSAIEKTVSCHRFTTQIAEVKAATAQIRLWLDQGVAIDQIGIFATRIESYWPALESYLFTEGVPVQKNSVASVASLPSFGRWLARLKIECREFECGHLEAALYGKTRASVKMNFEKFEQLFNRIYDEKDLCRDSSVRELFHFEFAPNDKITRDEFFSWSLKFWSDDPSDFNTLGLDLVSAEILLECPKNFRLNLNSWVSYLSAIAARSELKLLDGATNGIYCTSFGGAQNLNLQNIILLGLNESNLRENLDLSINMRDVQKLAQDLGVYLDSPDKNYNEYLVHRLAEHASGEVHLYYSATDFSGQVQAPSLIWLQTAISQNFDIEKYIVPPLTRWDERQHAPLPSVGFAEIEKYVLQDLGRLASTEFKPKTDLRFSPTQIQKYLQCPFIFGAEKLFNLSDLPDVDLDVDAMTSGRILHALLDKLLSLPLHKAHTDVDIANVVDEVRVALALPLGEERLWPVKRQHFVRLAKKFLDFEREWRATFSGLRTVGRELRINGEMVLSEDLKIKVSGQIDRVDAFELSDHSENFASSKKEPEYVVIDYKSGAGQLRNHSGWLTNNELQLAFYTIAISQGLTDLKKGPVIGAFYYVLANMNREKGFRVLGHENKLFAANEKNRSQISQDDLFALLGEVKIKISEVVRHIYQGHLQPKPQDEKLCGTCHWRTLCRAPHLN